jgi:hypothetical protein
MVAENDTFELNRKVNVYLEDGYELYGPPMTTLVMGDVNEQQSNYLVFSQALYKP